MTHCLEGFNGERRDPVSGTSHLGCGYRAYNPVLMRFNCTDSWSPFGKGGVNPYAYCGCDPVNQADRSGHMSTGQWVGMGLGLLAGIALGIVTEGASMPAVLTLMATVTGDAAIGAGTELASEVIDRQRISWAQVGIAAGINGAATLVGYGVGVASKLKGSSNRPIGGLMMQPTVSTSTEKVSASSIFTTYENMKLARNTELNCGIGNCEYVAKRAFQTLLTGSASTPHPFKETLMGITKLVDNFFPFRKLMHPAEMYESMLRKTTRLEGPFPEIKTITFSAKSSMENSLKKASPFSVFWATSVCNFGMGDTNHAFVIARGIRPEEYHIFDKFSEESHYFATYEPSAYFDAFKDFEVELTGFL